MRLIVKPHKIIIDKDKLVNEKEIDISKCTFEFDEEITDDFVKEALFTFKGTTYEQLINNNECAFPQEVLAEKGQVEIGVVAYKVENEVEIKRYNPSPAYFNTLLGSLKDDIENSEPITPTDKEQILSELANKQDTLVSSVNIKTINNETLLGEGNINITGGSGGTSDYEDLDNKPSINDVELSGNKSLNDLGIQPAGSYALASDIPTNLSQLTDDTTHRLVTDTEKTTWNNKSDFSGSYNDLTNKPTLFSGDYNDLTNKPTIPTKTSDLTNDSGFVGTSDLSNYYTKSETNALIPPLFTIELTNIRADSRGQVDIESQGNNIQVMSDFITNVFSKNIYYFVLLVKYSNGFSYMYRPTGNLVKNVGTNQYYLYSDVTSEGQTSTTYIRVGRHINITGVWNDNVFTCTKITISPETRFDPTQYLTKTNTAAYTPTSDYNPAHKKYVDDSIASAITTTLNGNY